MMFASLLLFALAQEETHVVPKAHKGPYQEALEAYRSAENKIDPDPETAVRILTEILDNPAIEHRECRLRIEVQSGKYDPPVEFHPYRLRGRARMALAKSKRDPGPARAAVRDFQESVRRKVAGEKELKEAEELAGSLEKKPEPPKIEPKPDQIWRESFEKTKPKLAYLTFHPKDEESRRSAKEVLSSSAAVAAEIDAWLKEQTGLLPPEPGPKPGWLAKRDQALRIVDWVAMIAEILPGSFEKIRGALQEIRSRFEPVARYRGKITLKILILPYANLRSLQAGEDRLVRDGKRLPDADVGLTGENLSTPLVLRGLDIATIRMTFVDEKAGEHAVEIREDELVEGRTYLYAGSLAPPKSLRLLSP